MSKRKAISKKARFEVFKRDSFTCQYCGGTPPAVVLEVDHIDPVSKGGTNDKDNLVAACFECNRGKSDALLTDIPESIEDKRALLLEKELQLKAYKNLKSAIKRRQTKQVNQIEALFQETFPDEGFSEKAKNTIRHQFTTKLEQEDLEFAMSRACSKLYDDSYQAMKYFYGICWRMIKEK